jgi:hypothetical protein
VPAVLKKTPRALETTSISPNDLIKMGLTGPKKQKIVHAGGETLQIVYL